MTPGNCGPAVAQNAVRCIHGTSVLDMVDRLVAQEIRTGRPARREVLEEVRAEIAKCQRCPAGREARP